jgi:hypothetical protein
MESISLNENFSSYRAAELRRQQFAAPANLTTVVQKII